MKYLNQADIIGKIESLDTSIFAIETQTFEPDRTTLLSIQRIIRNVASTYNYLEVGSHVGGTLMPHMVDSKCNAVVSVDARPESQPDERGRDFDYHQNSTDRMVKTLAEFVPDAGMAKLTTFDCDVSC